MSLPINKQLIEKAKTAVIFAAIVFALGYYFGNHNAKVNAQSNVHAITTAVHATLSKQ